MSKKVLIVDDEPNIRRVVKLVLESDGFDVATAQDAQECLNKLKENPDLVLLDILMPKVPGTSVLQSIMKTRPHTKVVMLSVIQSEFHKQLCRDMGAVGYITKPFNNKDLIRVVKSTISLKKVSVDITYHKQEAPIESHVQFKKGPQHLHGVKLDPNDIRTVQINAINIIKRQLEIESRPLPIVEDYKAILEPLKKSRNVAHHRFKNN
jgi:DNA-binding response OmpR family regulator